MCNNFSLNSARKSPPATVCRPQGHLHGSRPRGPGMKDWLRLDLIFVWLRNIFFIAISLSSLEAEAAHAQNEEAIRATTYILQPSPLGT